MPAPPFYASDSLNTEIYDARTALHIAGSPVEGDVAYLLERASQTGGPVLDVGCGTGRVAVPLAEAGDEVVGIDLSGSMLRMAQARLDGLPAAVRGRLSYRQADMTDFDLGRRFRLIVAPYRVFMFLLTPDDQRSSLRALRRHLEPWGELVIDLFDPRLDLCVPIEEPYQPVSRGDVSHPLTGNLVRMESIERVNDPMGQVFVETWRITEVGSDGDALRTEVEQLSLRWTYRQEMRHLFELEGLEVIAEHGNFRGAPPTYGREQVWVVRRAG